MTYRVFAPKFGDVLEEYFRDGAFIPEYQRDYVWTREDAIGLYEDLCDKRTSYMGPMVVVETVSGNRVEIVDGQQRLTTLSLLLYFIRSFCKYGYERTQNDYAKDVFEEVEQRTTRLIGEKSKPFITHDLLKEKNAYEDATRRSLDAREARSGDSRITKCWDAARDFIFERVFNENYNKWIETNDLANPCNWDKGTAALVKKAFSGVIDEAQITPIKVAGEETAFLVFERLNSKGVPLSAIELIKNTILRKSRELNNGNCEFGSIKQTWSELLKHSKDIKLSPAETVRVCLSVHDLEFFRDTKQASLYEDTKRYIDSLKDKRDCSRFTKNLSELAEQLSILHRQKFVASKKSNYDRQPYPLLLENNYKSQWAPILLAHRRCPEMGLATAEFALRILLRQAGIKGRGNRIADELRKYIYSILESNPTDADTLYQALCDNCNLDDKDEVMHDLIVESTFKNNSTAKTILLLCCCRQMPSDWFRPDLSEIELEHVLPQDPKEWSSYQVGDNDDQTIENLWEDGAIQANYSSKLDQQIYSIGNCALLHQSINKSISNSEYGVKKNKFQKYDSDTNEDGSSYPITHTVDKIASQYGDRWTKECIRNRAEEVAKTFLRIVPADGRRES